MTEKYLNNLLPKVLRSDLKLYDFDLEYIKNRLLIETSVSEEGYEDYYKEVINYYEIKVSEQSTGEIFRQLNISF